MPIPIRFRPIPDASDSEKGIGASRTISFNVGVDPNLVQDTSEKRKIDKSRWTPTEEVVLINAWINTDKFVEVAGNEVKAAAFWKRIAAYVSASPKVAEKREPNQCKQKWRRINDIVWNFVRCYERANSQLSNGQVDDNDVMKLAYQLFYNDCKVTFTLEHAWRELRNNQKWCAFNTRKKRKGSSKKRKLDDGCAQSISSNTVSHLEDQAMARPSGVMKEKGEGSSPLEKGKETKGIDQTREEQGEGSSPLEKDLAMREKLAKMGLLDSLITKKEPLSDMELTLKNKLITDMLNNI